MGVHKLYPHEKILKNLKADHRGFSIEDIEDQDIHNALEQFETYKEQARSGALDPNLIEASREIADAINQYMDSEYDEEEEEESLQPVEHTNKVHPIAKEEQVKEVIHIPTIKDIEASMEIVDAIDEQIDSEYDEDEQKESIYPIIKYPAKVDWNAKETSVREDKDTSIKQHNELEVNVSFVPKLSNDELALESLYKAKKTTNITLEDLKNVGFRTGLWSNLTSRGFKGKFYELLKDKGHKVYRLFKL